MVCKIDHTQPDALPAFLCRECHPELVMTAEHRAQLDAQDAEQRRKDQARRAKEFKLARVQNRLASLERRERRKGGLCTVDEKVKLGLEEKAAKLLEELRNA